ncbi:hypothetical protein J1605_009514 [Eschrichtius robustus]|uniref:Uncharacterized protein n=1 Tax=Eschrichtius robustus TaxID=9764 RepID=A0AB34GR53_ESCRO|nr:hypothetical protein J1605_009514 [Eschrichtius robustus]
MAVLAVVRPPDPHFPLEAAGSTQASGGQPSGKAARSDYNSQHAAGTDGSRECPETLAAAAPVRWRREWQACGRCVARGAAGRPERNDYCGTRVRERRRAGPEPRRAGTRLGAGAGAGGAAVEGRSEELPGDEGTGRRSRRWRPVGVAPRARPATPRSLPSGPGSSAPRCSGTWRGRRVPQRRGAGGSGGPPGRAGGRAPRQRGGGGACARKGFVV